MIKKDSKNINKNKKILFLRNMKDDFVFTASYTQMLAELIIAKGNFLYIYDFRKRKLMNYNEKIVINYYKIFDIFNKSIFRLVTNFFAFIYFAFKHKKYFDIVHVLYIRAEYMIGYKFLKLLGPKIILSIFGSDINLNYKIKKHFKGIFRVSDMITVTNPGQLELFLNNYFSKEDVSIMRRKSKVLMYPLKTIEILKNKSLDSEIRRIKSINKIKDELIIFCGNTANLELEQLYMLVDELYYSKMNQKYNCKMIFPLTYGGNSKDTKLFIKYLHKLFDDENLIILDEYLSIENNLAYRRITDIYINVRKHDQFVATMIEAFYSGCEVIVGNWLPYKFLKQNNFYYHTIDDIKTIWETLESVIIKLIDNKNIQLLKNNKMMVEKLWSPYVVNKKWIDIYTN